MRILLDTHILLWALVDSPRLPATARSLILDSANDVYASSATVWEIAIKHALSRSSMPISAREVTKYIQAAGYHDLPITAIHAAAIEELPPLHKDPFDRMLVAQAHVEPLRLVTHDSQLQPYGAMVLLV